MICMFMLLKKNIHLFVRSDQTPKVFQNRPNILNESVLFIKKKLTYVLIVNESKNDIDVRVVNVVIRPFSTC